MTMIASSGLRRIINEDANFNPASILKKLNFIVKTSLQQDKEHAESDDGLDAGICHYDARSDIMRFSGARLPLFYIQDRELAVIKGDKTSIGYISSDLEHEFTEHTIPDASCKSFYLATDGFTDQLGGPKTRRLGSKTFKNLIQSHYQKPFHIQKKRFTETFDMHLGRNDRTDDVTIAGFKPGSSR